MLCCAWTTEGMKKQTAEAFKTLLSPYGFCIIVLCRMRTGASSVMVRLHGSYAEDRGSIPEDRGSIPGRFGVLLFLGLAHAYTYVNRVKRV